MRDWVLNKSLGIQTNLSTRFYLLRSLVLNWLIHTPAKMASCSVPLINLLHCQILLFWDILNVTLVTPFLYCMENYTNIIFHTKVGICKHGYLIKWSTTQVFYGRYARLLLSSSHFLWTLSQSWFSRWLGSGLTGSSSLKACSEKSCTYENTCNSVPRPATLLRKN